METGDYRFPRAERLKNRADIRQAMRKGRSVSAYGAKLFVLERQTAGTSEASAVDASAATRIAFTFARKYGNAVQRNRAKRLGREAYRHLRQGLRPGCDLVLLVFPPRGEAGSAEGSASAGDRQKQLAALFAKAHLYGKKRDIS
jgi:ribonuclease P protein component